MQETDDSLRWSDELESFSIDGEPACDVPDYLFRAEGRFSKAFWGLAAELTQLNDFCVMLLTSTKEQLNSLRRNLQKLRLGKERIDTPLGDFTGEMMMMLEEHIPVWEDTYHFLCRATCLVLLLAFVERSLKMLVETLTESAQPRGGARNRSQSRIAQYLDVLRKMCGPAFVEPEGIALLDQCRYVRNAFAHGDWDEVRRLVRDIHLRNTFAAASGLLSAIEDAVWNSVWSEKQKGV